MQLLIINAIRAIMVVAMFDDAQHFNALPPGQMRSACIHSFENRSTLERSRAGNGTIFAVTGLFTIDRPFQNRSIVERIATKMRKHVRLSGYNNDKELDTHD